MNSDDTRVFRDELEAQAWAGFMAAAMTRVMMVPACERDADEALALLRARRRSGVSITAERVAVLQARVRELEAELREAEALAEERAMGEDL